MQAKKQLKEFGIEIPLKGQNMKRVKQPTLRELVLEIREDMKLIKSLPTIKKEIEGQGSKKNN